MVDHDSDATVIYDLEEYLSKKHKSEFKTKTCGIKITKFSRMYTCPGCRIKKTSVSSVNEHYKHYLEKEKCKICGKTFQMLSSHNKHMYNYKSKKHCPCEHCDKDFPFESMLNNHRGMHTSTKRYP